MKITFKSALCVFLITLSQALTHAVYAHEESSATLPASALSITNVIVSGLYFQTPNLTSYFVRPMA